MNAVDLSPYNICSEMQTPAHDDAPLTTQVSGTR